MEMDEIVLSTTIVSRTLSPLKALCNFITFRRMRRQQPTPPGLSVPTLHHVSSGSVVPTIPCGKELLASLQYVQDVHNISSMRSITDSLCRTKLVCQEKLVSMVPDGMTLNRPITCGGMSRIYLVTLDDLHTHAIMKVSNLKTSLGKFEIFGYDLLRKHGLPIPHVYTWSVKNGHLVIVIEKLECTVSTLVTAIAYHPEHNHLVWSVITALQDLLARLHTASITFCDLSPDNIMCRATPDGLQLVLIDPQFTIPCECLSKTLGEQWAKQFDIVHFALKIQALSVLSNNVKMKCITNAIVTALVGKEPDPLDVRKWLLREIPIGLRGAYSALKRIHRANFSLYPIPSSSS
jgi:hypothetical protein